MAAAEQSRAQRSRSVQVQEDVFSAGMAFSGEMEEEKSLCLFAFEGGGSGVK